MTVAVVVKVFDGMVFAADSATTMTASNGIAQVWNNANKIFHLHRDLPVAAMTWGLGAIGSASISTLAKDLRLRLMGKDDAYRDWALDPQTFTIKQVADRFVEMFYDDLYVTEFGTGQPGPQLGLLVGGYSAGVKQAEAWEVLIDGTSRPTPDLRIPFDGSGWLSFAQPYATERLFLGMDNEFWAGLKAALDPASWTKIQGVLQSARREPVIAGMPFGDAIGLARFLVEVTVGFSHHLFGPDTVGGPIEIAGINRHEGFKWIERKHYYSQTLNPEEPRHA